MSGACGSHFTAVPWCQDSRSAGMLQGVHVYHQNSTQLLEFGMIRMFCVTQMSLLSKAVFICCVHMIVLQCWQSSFVFLSFLKTFFGLWLILILLHAWPIFRVKEIEYFVFASYSCSKMFILCVCWTVQCMLSLLKERSTKCSRRSSFCQIFLSYIRSSNHPVSPYFSERFKSAITEISKASFYRSSLLLIHSRYIHTLKLLMV